MLFVEEICSIDPTLSKPEHIDAIYNELTASAYNNARLRVSCIGAMTSNVAPFIPP